MNSTQWSTLGGFVRHLGRSGKAIVEESDKGWYVTYVDRDPEALAKMEKMKRRSKAEADEEERRRKVYDEILEKK